MPIESNKTDPDPTAWNAVFSIALGVAGLIMAEFLPTGVLTPISRDLGITEGMAGQSVSATSVAAVVTSLTLPYLSRRVNRRTVMLILSLLLICSNLLVAFSPNFATLLGGRFMLGIALGGFWSMAAAIAMRLVPQAEGPRAIAIIFGGCSLASVLAAPLGSFLGGIIGWRSVFLLSATLSIVAFLWQALTLPSLKPIGETRMRTVFDVLRIPHFSAGMLAVAAVFCGHFALFTYLRPFLETTTGVGVNRV
ncbi:MAG: transporter, partial [Akkermansiaceae bacterium]|nr:transporter [Akkermansiaceae bacterium]